MAMPADTTPTGTPLVDGKVVNKTLRDCKYGNFSGTGKGRTAMTAYAKWASLVSRSNDDDEEPPVRSLTKHRAAPRQAGTTHACWGQAWAKRKSANDTAVVVGLDSNKGSNNCVTTTSTNPCALTWDNCLANVDRSNPCKTLGLV